MNKLALTTGVGLGLLLSCGTTEEITEVVVKKEKKIKSLVIGDPFDCGIPDMLVFPVGTAFYTPQVTGTKKNNSEMIDNYIGTTTTASGTMNLSTFAFDVNSSSAGSIMNDRYAKVEFVNINNDHDMTNLIFYDMTTGESYPLFEEKLHILSFAIHNELDQPLVFYRVVRDDYNKDEKYNSSDPIMLYTSRLDGSKMTRMTPEGAQFVDYTHYPKFNKILAKTRIDSDVDSTFTAYDETNFTEVSLSDTVNSKEIFSKELKEMLYDQIGYNRP